MSTITDIFERIAERRGWVDVPNSKFDELEAWETQPKSAKDQEKETWNEVMKTLHEPFAVVCAALDDGLEHVGIVLELLPKPKGKKGEDPEAKGDDPKPGDVDFTKYVEQKLADFYSKRGETLRAWARQKGLSEDSFDKPTSPTNENVYNPDEAQHRRDQSQLYLILFLEHLLYSTGIAIKNLSTFI